MHARIQSGIGRSFQSLELFESSTVRENLGVASEPWSVLRYPLDLVRPHAAELSSYALHAIRHLGLTKQLDTRVSDLPYGQRRLVAIARAVARGPSLLLLDEPAAGLSSSETMELAEAIRSLTVEMGVGVLVVEHDMAFVMGLCDKVIVLNFGEQIAQGAPEVIRADPAVITAYLGDTSRRTDIAPNRDVVAPRHPTQSIGGTA